MAGAGLEALRAAAVRGRDLGRAGVRAGAGADTAEGAWGGAGAPAAASTARVVRGAKARLMAKAESARPLTAMAE